MRAGRLLEILYGDQPIRVIGAGPEAQYACATDWVVDEFCRRFPDTEVIKLFNRSGRLHVRVYWDTAKALHEGRYEDVTRYTQELETHNFDSDTDFITKITARSKEV